MPGITFRSEKDMCRLSLENGDLFAEYTSEELLKSITEPIDFEGHSITMDTPDIFFDALILKYDPHPLHAKDSGQFMAKPGARRSRFRIDGKISGRGSKPKAKKPRNPHKDFRAIVREHLDLPYQVRGSQGGLADARVKAVHTGEERTGNTMGWKKPTKEGKTDAERKKSQERVRDEVSQQEAGGKKEGPRTKAKRENEAAYQDRLAAAKKPGGMVEAWHDISDSEARSIIAHYESGNHPMLRFGADMSKHILDLRAKAKDNVKTDPKNPQTKVKTKPEAPAADVPYDGMAPGTPTGWVAPAPKKPALDNPQAVRDAVKAEYVQPRRHGIPGASGPAGDSVTHPNNHARGHKWATEKTSFSMDEAGYRKIDEFHNNAEEKMKAKRAEGRSADANFFDGARQALAGIRDKIKAYLSGKGNAPKDKSAAGNAVERFRAKAMANVSFAGKHDRYKAGYNLVNNQLHLHPAAIDIPALREKIEDLRTSMKSEAKSDSAKHHAQGQIDAAEHIISVAEQHVRENPNDKPGTQNPGRFPAVAGVKFNKKKKKLLLGSGSASRSKKEKKPEQPKADAEVDLNALISMADKMIEEGLKKPKKTSIENKAPGGAHPLETGKMPTDQKKYKQIGKDKDCVNDVYLTELDNGAKGVFKPDAGAASFWENNYEEGYSLANHEAGASIVNDALGFNIVKKVVIKDGMHEGKPARGSVMEFIENAETKNDRPAMAKNVSEQDRVQMQVLDLVIGNFDRHGDNWMIDDSGKAWAIDNGGTFMTNKVLDGYHLKFASYTGQLPTKASPEVVASLAKFIADRPKIEKSLKGMMQQEQIDDMFKRAEFVHSFAGTEEFGQIAGNSDMYKSRLDSWLTAHV